MSTKQNVKAIVRVRPLLNFEDEPAWLGSQQTLQCMDTKSVKKKLNKGSQSSDIDWLNYHFRFQKVVQSLTSERIYKNQIRKMIEKSILEYVNSTIVAYGQTCSGKTYTLLGIKQAPGFIPCAFKDIFNILKHSANQVNNIMSVTVSLSYIEIYNEKLIDLLNPKGHELKIVNDQQWGADVKGCQKIQVTNFNECLQVLDIGEENRKYATKENHERSSRSHTILKIYIQQRDHNFGQHRSLINIVDLAGSQRLCESSTNAAETGHINKSLFQFSNVISKLSENNEQHIPFRDSKLTRLLEPSLTNNSSVSIIFCISPAVQNLNESLSTLRLATKAKKIQYQLQSNIQTVLSSKQIKKLYEKLALKQKQIRQMATKIKQLELMIKSKDEQIKFLNRERPTFSQFEVTDRQQKIKMKIVALVDHENFLIPSLQYDSAQSLEQSIQKVKENLIKQIGSVYQKYASQIVQIHSSDKNLAKKIQIQEICFLDMVYNRKNLLQYRVKMLRNLLSSNQQSQISQQYAQIINQYLLQCENQNSQMLQPQDVEASELLKINQPSQATQKLYCWGSRKQYRVFKTKDSQNKNIETLGKGFGKIIDAQCGAHHTLFVNNQGTVFGWGKNDHNQICNVSSNSKTEFISIPKELKLTQKIKLIAAGWGHSLALTFYGRAYSWGYGKDGQLGHGDKINLQEPKIIESLKNIGSIYAGHSHSGFIDTSGYFYSNGFNKDFRLMISSSQQILEPTKVEIRNVVKAALGVSHSCLLTSTGKIYCGGVGTNGQLGIELNQEISGFSTVQCPQKNFFQEPVEKICPIVQLAFFNGINKGIDISCGQNFTAIVTSKKQLYTFGKNSYNRLGHLQKGIFKILQNVDHTVLGLRHGFAWNSETQEVYGWGFNMYNQLGIQQAKDLKTPHMLQKLSCKHISRISAGFFHSIGLGKQLSQK